MEIPSHCTFTSGFYFKVECRAKEWVVRYDIKEKDYCELLLKGNHISLTYSDSLVMTFESETYPIEIIAQGVTCNQCLTNSE